MVRGVKPPDFGKSLKREKGAPPTPTPDDNMPMQFLYRNGRQVGLNWEFIKEQNAARVSEEAERLKPENSSAAPKDKKKVLRRD